MLALGPGEAADLPRLLAQVEAWDSGATFLGLSEKEVVRRLGQPTSRRPGVWEYWAPLGPGCHTHREVRVVRFTAGRVISAAVELRGVGCIIVERKGR
jgi:hypothetical protein